MQNSKHTARVSFYGYNSTQFLRSNDADSKVMMVKIEYSQITNIQKPKKIEQVPVH